MERQCVGGQYGSKMEVKVGCGWKPVMSDSLLQIMFVIVCSTSSSSGQSIVIYSRWAAQRQL